MPSPRLLFLLAAVPLALDAQGARSTTPYATHQRLSASLDSVARAKPQLVQVSELAKSPGGRGVHLVRLGAGRDLDARPAVLLVANAYGPHIVGSEIALRTVRDLAAQYDSDASVKALLDRVTVYVMPRLNPDAAEGFFRTPLYERTGNDGKTDNDRDGVFDEDGAVDLNGDGVITQMRVLDPRGEWIPDAIDPQLMRRADPRKGEVGQYRVLIEGRDLDGDGQFSEDGIGGTDINKNFSNDFTFFRDGGEFPFESAEARALPELFMTKPGIVAVFVIGPQENLMRPWEGRSVPGIAGNPQGTSAGGPLTAMLPPDAPWLAEVGRRFRTTLGVTRVPGNAAGDGDPLSWAYYHMGRFAFGSRGWWIPDAPADTARARRVEGPDPIAEERNAYRWLRANAPDQIVAWTAVQHPDFPGKTVEVGGIKPYATLVPPAGALDAVTSKHVTFVKEMAGMLPQLALREIKVESVGGRVYRITAQVANTGYLPTNAAIGTRVRWSRRVRVDLTTGADQSIVSGRGMQLIDAITGSGGSVELSWLVVGAAGSTVTLKAETPMAGSVSETITLRAR